MRRHWGARHNPGASARRTSFTESEALRTLLALPDERTALVVVPHCHWTDGSLLDLERLGTTFPGQEGPPRIISSAAFKFSVVKGVPGEVGAIPELLKLLELKGAVVTADANACTAKVAQAVVDRGADYVLSLKGNRGPLHAHVKHLFAAILAGKQAEQVDTHCGKPEEGHGRHEVRSAWALALQTNALPRSAHAWAKLKTAVLVKRERRVGNQTRVEWRYYVSSLPPKARKLARIIREHWGVENGLHWSLDVSMGEDARRIRDHTGAQNFALLSRMALTSLRRETTSKDGEPTKRKLAG